MLCVSPEWVQVLISVVALILAWWALRYNKKLQEDQHESLELEKKKLLIAHQPFFSVDAVTNNSNHIGPVNTDATQRRTIRLKRNIAQMTRIQSNVDELDPITPIAERMEPGDYFEIDFVMEGDDYIQGKHVATLTFRDEFWNPYTQLVYWDTDLGNLNTNLPILMPQDIKTIADELMGRNR